MVSEPNLSHSANARIRERFASQVARSGNVVAFDDAYHTLGTHPDLVERLWGELGAELPLDCRWVAFGCPALVQPDTGIIFGLAFGSLTYCVRLPPDSYEAAIEAGHETVHTYPDDTKLDLKSFGEGWVFGSWSEKESGWIVDAFNRASSS